MRITFLGAARTVTGSCYLIETERSCFLLDCGMFQGNAREKHANAAAMPFRMEDVDFLLLSHAHIDHSGRIPKLYKDGFRSPIYATKATSELSALMLPDSAHIQEMEHEWRNRKNARAGRPEEEPLYTVEDANGSLSLFRPQRYDASFRPSEDVEVTFRDAGHVLGSAIVELSVLEGGKTRKVVFSGDLGNTGIPIMRDPTKIEGAELLVLETTYGDRLHDRKIDKVDKFVAIVNETIRAGGNVVIPSFAVGRTQEIIYEINRQIALGNGSDPERRREHEVFLRTPVIVDSPLAVSATEVFRNNEDCFDEEAQSYIRNRDNPLDFPNLRFSRTKDESVAINQDQTPKIIIASSGMCDAGRIRHHLKHNLWRPESTILFVGYQAPGTLGRQLMDGSKRVTMFGEDITVKARVESIEGFSGHADRDGLLGWVSAMQNKPARVVLVHGEPESMEAFAGSLAAVTDAEVKIPGFGESMVFGAETPVRHVKPAAMPETAAIAPERDRRKGERRVTDRRSAAQTPVWSTLSGAAEHAGEAAGKTTVVSAEERRAAVPGAAAPREATAAVGAVVSLSAERVLSLSVDISASRRIGAVRAGELSVIPITGGSFTGRAGLAGRVLPGGSDWNTRLADGLSHVVAKYEIETDAGIVIGVENEGIVDFSDPEAVIRTTPRFTVARGVGLDWLSSGVFVGELRPRTNGTDGVEISIYRMR